MSLVVELESNYQMQINFKGTFMYPSTADNYSPWSLLPAPEPRKVNYEVDYFYHNVAKHLISDTVRIMSNGIHIDLDKVSELEQTLDDQLLKVKAELASNPYIQRYLEERYSHQLALYKQERTAKLKQPSDFIKPFKHNDVIHRSYFMHFFCEAQSIPSPSELLPSNIPKWSTALTRKFAASYPLLKKLLDGTLSPTHSLVVKAMELLASHKCDMYNSKYASQISNPSIPFPEFNSGSSQQRQELFSMLGIESESTSAVTGNESFSRAEIERINKETDDEHIRHITQCFIDYSFAAIVRNNFIEAFYRYTVNNRLYGQYKLFGAKSF